MISPECRFCHGHPITYFLRIFCGCEWVAEKFHLLRASLLLKILSIVTYYIWKVFGVYTKSDVLFKKSFIIRIGRILLNENERHLHFKVHITIYIFLIIINISSPRQWASNLRKISFNYAKSKTVRDTLSGSSPLSVCFEYADAKSWFTFQKVRWPPLGWVY